MSSITFVDMELEALTTAAAPASDSHSVRGLADHDDDRSTDRAAAVYEPVGRYVHSFNVYEPVGRYVHSFIVYEPVGRYVHSFNVVSVPCCLGLRPVSAASFISLHCSIVVNVLRCRNGLQSFLCLPSMP